MLQSQQINDHFKISNFGNMLYLMSSYIPSLTFVKFDTKNNVALKNKFSIKCEILAYILI